MGHGSGLVVRAMDFCSIATTSWNSSYKCVWISMSYSRSLHQGWSFAKGRKVLSHVVSRFSNICTLKNRYYEFGFRMSFVIADRYQSLRTQKSLFPQNQRRNIFKNVTSTFHSKNKLTELNDKGTLNKKWTFLDEYCSSRNFPSVLNGIKKFCLKSQCKNFAQNFKTCIIKLNYTKHAIKHLY